MPRRSPDNSHDERSNNLQVVCAKDCPAQPVEWLWPGKIPIGKVTLLIGDPGTGKSLVALDIAARASRLVPWPDDANAQGDQWKTDDSFETPPPRSIFGPFPSSTILLSATDDLADTIRPRLDAAGAELQSVFVIPSIADLGDDFDQLCAAVNRAPNCRLIIIDPINAYVGHSDTHFQTVVRKVLAPLAKFATERRIAVLAIAHLRKNHGAAIYRAAGSMGFVAAARAVWTIARDPSNPGRYLFLPLKHNLSAATPGLAYTIDSAPNGAPTLTWDSKPITTPAEEILSGPGIADLNAARQWLRKTLANGPRAASEVTQEAAHHGFHERTLRRALHAISGNTQNRGLLEGWWWSIPSVPNDETKAEGGERKADDNLESAMPTSSLPPSAFPIPPAAEPVPFCPLPGIFNDSTYSDPTLEPSVSDAIAAIHRRDIQRLIDRHLNTNRKPKRRPKKTGHPILDATLDALRKSLVTNPDSSPQPAPDSS